MLGRYEIRRRLEREKVKGLLKDVVRLVELRHYPDLRQKILVIQELFNIEDWEILN